MLRSVNGSNFAAMGETPAEAGEELVAEPGPGPTGPEPDGPDAPPDSEGPAPTTAPGPVALARARVLLPVYAALAVALTWPLTLHMGSHLAYGSEPTTTVPSFNLWTLRWNQHMFGSGLSGYWDAPLFHPATGTFALSEPQPLTGLVFAPISWVTGNPVLAFNLVALAIFVLNGFFGARLARHLGVGPGPAVLTGVLAMGTPFVASQMGVLQLTVIFPLIALVDALVRWAPAGGRKPAAEVGLWLAVTFLTCGYYGLFALVGILPLALLLARRDWFRRSRLVDVALAGLCFAPAVPILLAQQRLTEGYERSEETIRALSALVGDFSELTGDALGAGLLPWVRDGGDDISLYSGTAFIVVGIAGAVVLKREAGERQRVLAFLAGGAVATLLLALGLNLSFFGFEPYQVVRSVVPGYHSLRSPFRFVALTEVFLVALAAFGLEDLWRWRPSTGPGGPSTSGWARRAGALAAAAVVVLGVAEVSLAPVELFEVDQSQADWVGWLRDRRDEEAGVAGDDEVPDDVIAFLPFPVDGKARSYAATVDDMLDVLDAGDGVTTVNGYSGLWPDSYEDLENAAVNYPTEEADFLFREDGVTLLVADADWLAERQDVVTWLSDRYVEEYEGPDSVVYSMPATSGTVVPSG